MDENKIRVLLNAVQDKGYIGAGVVKLENDPNWLELRKMFAVANIAKPAPAKKIDTFSYPPIVVVMK